MVLKRDSPATIKRKPCERVSTVMAVKPSTGS